jgi:Bacterial surface proteins containing Ig-like domains
MGGYQRHEKRPLLFGIYKVVMISIIIMLCLHSILMNSSLFYRNIITLPFSLHLNKQDIYMIKGEETHLSVFGINKRVSYSSTNFRVVGVNFTGRLFAYNTGKAFILAKVDHKVLKCRIHVIDINKKKLTLKEGKSYRLSVKGSGSLVSWKSSKKSVATVSMFGKVKAVRKGKTVITAKVKGRTLHCTVVVK